MTFKRNVQNRKLAGAESKAVVACGWGGGLGERQVQAFLEVMRMP